MVVNNVLFRLGNYVKGDRLLRYPFAPSVEFVGVGLPDDPVILQGKMTSPYGDPSHRFSVRTTNRRTKGGSWGEAVFGCLTSRPPPPPESSLWVLS